MSSFTSPITGPTKYNRLVAYGYEYFVQKDQKHPSRISRARHNGRCKYHVLSRVFPENKFETPNALFSLCHYPFPPFHIIIHSLQLVLSFLASLTVSSSSNAYSLSLSPLEPLTQRDSIVGTINRQI